MVRVTRPFITPSKLSPLDYFAKFSLKIYSLPCLIEHPIIFFHVSKALKNVVEIFKDTILNIMSHFIPNQVIIVDDWEPKFKIKIKAKEINKMLMIRLYLLSLTIQARNWLRLSRNLQISFR